MSSTRRLLHPCMLAGMLALGSFCGPAHADIDPLSGIDFVRITHPGNAPWAGDGTPNDRAIGRGSVGYEYSIGRFEVTTSQWVQFFNAAYDRPVADRLPHLIPPDHWGAVGATPNTPGGLRWQVPAGNQMRPVGDISWRMAAMYCNWLHNNKSTDRQAFLNGAYDVSTFGYVGSNFTDQLTHHPDARYWIPTWDEHLKASHYDPHRFGPDQGGWWLYNTTRDVPTIPGAPPSMGGIGEANTGGWGGGPSPFSIPLGAYSDVTSPWGLFDTAGGTAEWIEDVRFVAGTRTRLYEGSWWVDGPPVADRISAVSDVFPSLSTFDLGFRIASSVPGPSTGMLLVCAGAWLTRRNTRSASCQESFCCSSA